MLSKSLEYLALALFLLLAVVKTACIAGVEGAEQASSIHWGNDLNDALRQASKTGQPILVHFYSDNCVPCKMLEAKAFKDRSVCDSMAKSVLPVKIKYDLHRDIAQRYLVTRFPTDLFLHPNGEELYRTVSPQDPEDYVKLLDRVASKNREWVVYRMSKIGPTINPKRASISAAYEAEAIRDSQPTTTTSQLFKTTSQPNGKVPVPEANRFCVAPTSVTAEPTAEAASETRQSPFHLASQTAIAKENRYQRPVSSEQRSTPDTSKSNSEPALVISDNTNDSSPMASVTMGGVFADDKSLAMDGYCPVLLLTQKAWTLGTAACAVRHRGRVYYCANEEARTLFLQEPDRYSPVMSGYDIVHFLETGELVSGQRQFGCEFLGRVFIFMNASNKAHFDIHAVQYARNLQTQVDSGRVANGTSGSAVQR